MTKKIKVMTVFGTRPEAIKMLPIVKELEKNNDTFESVVVVTAQHRKMLDQVMEFFKTKPDYDLDIMKERQGLTQIATSILEEMENILCEEKPNIVLVHGDTTTTFAVSLAAFFQKIPVGHVEAGLRTWKKYSPFPEEMNRQLTDALSDIYFVPTQESKENLLRENRNEDNMFITGNTVIDALKYTVNSKHHHTIFDKLDSNKKLILLTMHRRENQGKPMKQVFEGIKEVVENNSDIEVVFPVHLNPNVQELANDILGNQERIHLIDPLEVVDFHNIASKSYVILSDSGGVQEEAPSLGVPVLVLRNETERPEGVAAGTLKLVGTDKVRVKTELQNILMNELEHKRMSSIQNPYGDGFASERILSIIQEWYEDKSLG
ncbi:UDP-N-acetylglucosamine 2-epimerase (non-hydrolyzing) [Bacillus anthracis]|nr:UDP-N-acetylglucosamine 2-epimerase (non-hydrolyzing) [Bacillus anthracis]